MADSIPGILGIPLNPYQGVNLSHNPLTPSPSPTRGEGSKKEAVWKQYSKKYHSAS